MAGYIQLWRDYAESMNSRLFVGVGAGIIGLSCLGYKLREHWRLSRYRADCMMIQQERDRKVYELEATLSKHRQDPEMVEFIVKLPLCELVAKLRNGHLSVVDTLHAYQTMALAAHRSTNCLTNIIEEAEDQAKQLDNAKVDGVQPRGLLYGVPVSVKDNIPTKGQVNSRGCVVFKNAIAKEDALLVEALKAEGAIPFVKTNIPQLMMGLETGNALYSVTANPHDLTRTPGGSSGGEGALIGFGASVLGLGTDIGGSIRIPSTFCGICGLKPTSGRLSLRGIVPLGQTIVRSCWGPMSRDVDSLVLAMDAALRPTMFTGDKTLPPLPFNHAVFSSTEPLTIGYYTDDGMYPAVPAMARAVVEAKQILEARGHKLVPWSPPEIEFAFEGHYKSLSGSKGCIYKGFLGTGEVIDASIQGLIGAFLLSGIARTIKVLLAKYSGERSLPLRLRGCRGVSSVWEWFQWTTQSKLYIQRFERHWNRYNLDAVLCPAFSHAAMKQGFTENNHIYSGYACLYNFLDYAAGVVPVTRVTMDDVAALDDYPVVDKLTAAVCRDQQDSIGLPANVQCVTPMWREELCLRVMKEIQDGVKDKRDN